MVLRLIRVFGEIRDIHFFALLLIHQWMMRLWGHVAFNFGLIGLKVSTASWMDAPGSSMQVCEVNRIHVAQLILQAEMDLATSVRSLTARVSLVDSFVERTAQSVSIL